MEDNSLPNGKDLGWTFQQIAEHNDERAHEAAQDIIRTANDRDLRTELIKLVTAYQTAKDSVASHEAFEEIIRYAKSQYGLILIQGFRMGQGYQQKVSHEAFAKILKGASDQAMSEASKVDPEKSKEEPETKSEK